MDFAKIHQIPGIWRHGRNNCPTPVNTDDGNQAAISNVSAAEDAQAVLESSTNTPFKTNHNNSHVGQEDTKPEITVSHVLKMLEQQEVDIDGDWKQCHTKPKHVVARRSNAASVDTETNAECTKATIVAKVAS